MSGSATTTDRPAWAVPDDEFEYSRWADERARRDAERHAKWLAGFEARAAAASR